MTVRDSGMSKTLSRLYDRQRAATKRLLKIDQAISIREKLEAKPVVRRKK